MNDWLNNSLGIMQQGAEKKAKQIIKNPKIDARYDLHGMNGNECYEKISRIVEHSWAAKQRQILIIHGIGKNILKNIVLDYCVNHPLLLACLKAPKAMGGDGATIIVLKRR